MDLSHYVGQEAVKRQLKALIDVAKSRSQPLAHILLCGHPGMGKGTLARAIANEVKKKVKECSNLLVIERPGDLAALITNLEDGDIMLIREIELRVRWGAHLYL
ncbi:MAG: AAA family ATPase [Deltaproteobacteria bacterium]|nr:AAA family ATPase [Deltaproteobacteria bacterium]